MNSGKESFPTSLTIHVLDMYMDVIY